MAVTIIKANQPDPTGPEKKRLLRVCAYCRVSTDMEEQESSYEAQCTHYTAFIKSNPAWTLAGIYADFGITGTQAKKRPEFLRMIEDCKAHRIDMVITKSISRFARNTLDCLQYIRLLKDLKIPVLFEKENINTLDYKGEILITIMASIAQQESASISQNVRMGIQFKMQQGEGILNTSCFLGYDKDENGSMVINPEQASLVRRIYRLYLEGRSPLMIAQMLTAEGIPSPLGKPQWHTSTVRSMLQNEKYAGDLLLQKYYTEDFLTHKLVKNNGKYPKYLVENHHDPIVPKPIFQQVQWERKRRGGNAMIRYGNKLALNGRLTCGCCGSPLRRFVSKDPSKTYWRCNNRKEDGCRIVKEEDVQAAVVEAFRKLPDYRDRLIWLQGQLQSDIRLIDYMIGQESSDQLNSQRADLASEEMQVRMLLELFDGVEAEDCPACSNAEDFFRRTAYKIPDTVLDQWGRIAVYDNDMVIRFIRSIVVRPDCFVVCFKGGVCIGI